MKKWEKEILQKQITDEQKVIYRLRDSYKFALDGVKEKIQVLQSREQTQSVIYQLAYQQNLQKQLEDIYSKMGYKWYSNIDTYLKECYEDSFYSTMYGLHQDGIPLVIPFNQAEMAQMAAQSDYQGIQLSQKLYTDSVGMAAVARQEITRGIAMGSTYADISRAVEKRGEANLNQACRIVRTESHRITNEVKQKTITKAQENGADVVKQWDSTIDKRTRKTHTELDGQLREIDQPFKIPSNGHTAMFPGGFGVASEDINCRCVMLERARWALDKSEVEKTVGSLDGVSDEQLEAWAQKFGVTKEELIKKSNGIIESDNSINHSIKAKSYNEFKKKYEKKEATQTAKYQAQLDILNQQKEDFKKKWGYNASYTDSDIDQTYDNFPQWKQTEEYKEWQKLKKQETALKKKIAYGSGAGGKTSSFDNDAFSDTRKAAARDFSDKYEADKFHRAYLDSQWDNLPDKEKYSVWEYTQNSNPLNKSLSGYHDSWSRYDFKGLGNTNWGHEDPWRSIPTEFKKFGKDGHVAYKNAITDLTKAIDKMELPDDLYLVRGSERDGFAGLLESIMPFGDAKDYIDRGDIASLKTLLEGNTVTNHAFTSTGIAQGTGFQKEVSYKIYAPKGTHGLYAEPQSYYGDTVGMNAELYKTGRSYYGVGNEAEVILQRGTKYRVSKVDYDGSSYSVEMEVVEQPDYFKHGDEETFNNGATRHKD